MVALRDTRDSLDRRPRWGVVSVLLLAVVLVVVLAPPALAFPDVPTNHPYADAITGLSDEGIIGGYTNGKFGLLDAVKRAQFAKMITGTLGIPPNSSTWTRFLDLGAPDTYGYPHVYVQAAFDNGITYGVNAAQDQFNPWVPIHRDQVVSMIVRGVNNLFPSALLDPPSGTYSYFADVPDPHGGNLRLAEYNGLLEGLIGLGPNWNVTANTTRGEVAQMLWNLFGHLVPAGVWVYADGSGDYPTIEAAVADLETGATIYLGPGLFQLRKTLDIGYELNLVGSGNGPGGTTVRFAGDVVGVDGVDFWASDISFVSTANSSASDVMYAEDGTVNLSNCTFAGGNLLGAEYGNGLSLYGSATGIVTHCTFTLNDLNGLVASEDAHLDIDNSVMTDNAQNGLMLMDDATALVDMCDCTNNGLHGISVNDFVDATVQNSTCDENGGNGNWASGIYFEEDATGTVYNCQCNSNWFDGIAIYNNAEVDIDHVTCSYNGERGIHFCHYSKGTVTSSICSYSVNHDGIVVHENAHAVLTDNLCTNNEEAGIYFGDYASGTADDNECAGNYWGLYVDATSNPTVYTNNYFHDNIYDYVFE